MGLCYPVDGLVIAGSYSNRNEISRQRISAAIEIFRALNDDTHGSKFRPAEGKEHACFHEWIEEIPYEYRPSDNAGLDRLLERKVQGTLVVESYNKLKQQVPKDKACRLGDGRIAVIALDLIDLRNHRHPDFMQEVFMEAHHVAAGFMRRSKARHWDAWDARRPTVGLGA